MFHHDTFRQGEFHSAGLAVQALVDMDGLSYDDYFRKITEMIEDLRHHWKMDQKVKALKVVIQLTKLLADTSQLKLYSKKYKMITDLLDEFGNLVYVRLQAKAGENNAGACDLFNTESSKVARETGRNWFLKVASIRELVPRFYIELAILKTCDILIRPSPDSRRETLTLGRIHLKSLERLTTAAFGIGDLVCALHARAYLCKVAQRLIPPPPGGLKTLSTSKCSLSDIVFANLQASITHISQSDFFGAAHVSVKASTHLKPDSRLIAFDLVSGCLRSVINTVALRCDRYTDDYAVEENVKVRVELICESLMSRVTHKDCPFMVNNIVIHSILKAIPGDILAGRSIELLDAIGRIYRNWIRAIDGNQNQASEFITLIFLTMESFALVLDESDDFDHHFSDESKYHILNSVQNMMNGLISSSETIMDGPAELQYLRCYKAWLSFASHYVEYSKLNELLNHFVSFVKTRRRYVNHHCLILELIKTLVSSKKTFKELNLLFGLDSLRQLVELPRKDCQKFELSTWILETTRASLRLDKNEQMIFSDEKMIDFILRLLTMMNESINLLTSPDDMKHLSLLALYFIDRMSIVDYDVKLDRLARYRCLLNNLNPVLEHLARYALALSKEFNQVEKEDSLRRNYMNSCLAFTFVTTPALNCQQIRLNIYIDGAQLAYEHDSLSIGDYYMEQIVKTLTECLRGGAVNPDRLLVDEVYSLADLMVIYEDHIDLKYKLVLTNLIHTSFSEYSGLIQTINLLKIIATDCEELSSIVTSA